MSKVGQFDTLTVAGSDFATLLAGKENVGVASTLISNHLAASNPHSQYQLTSQKGAALGYASLDGAGKIPASQLPNTLMDYLGNWDPTTNTPTLADGVGNSGDVYKASVAGTVNLGSGPLTFAVGDWVIYNGTIWEQSVNSTIVTGANQTLSNLTSPVAINQDLTLAVSNSNNLGSGSKRWATGYINTVNVSNVGGAGITQNGNWWSITNTATTPSGTSVDLAIQGVGSRKIGLFTGSAGYVLIETGNHTIADSGKISLQTGSASANNSGNIDLITGTAGVNSGTINLQTGTATGVRGNILFNANSVISTASLLCSSNFAYHLGDSTHRWGNIWSQAFVTNSTKLAMVGGALNLDTGVGVTPSGLGVYAAVTTDNSNNGTPAYLGIFTPTSNVSGANSGTGIAIETGNRTGGTGDSGSIIVKTGTSVGGNRGEVSIDALRLNVNSKNIVNVADPVNAQDATTKSWVMSKLKTVGATISSAGVVSNESQDFINGNASLATSTFTITLNPGFFSTISSVNCTIIGDVTASNLGLITVVSATTSTIVITCSTPGIGNIPRDFYITVTGT